MVLTESCSIQDSSGHETARKSREHSTSGSSVRRPFRISGEFGERTSPYAHMTIRIERQVGVLQFCQVSRALWQARDIPASFLPNELRRMMQKPLSERFAAA